MLQDKFNNYWDGSNSEEVNFSDKAKAGYAINAALINYPEANTQSVFANLFEWKVVKPLDGVMENREENPDKYWAYPGPNGELPGVVNINVRNFDGTHIGYINATGQFVKGEKFIPEPKQTELLLLAKANGKFYAWNVSILITNPKLFVLELNAHLFS